MTSASAWFGVVLVTISGAFAGWLESLLVPYYVGGTIVPITLVFALASNWYLPRIARALVPSTFAALLPFLAWIVVVFVVSASARPEGDVILPGGSLQYVSYGLMLAGGLAGIVSIVLSLPARSRARDEPQDLPPSAPGSSR